MRGCSINTRNETKIGEYIIKNFIFHFAFYAFFDMTNGLRINRKNGNFLSINEFFKSAGARY